MSTFQINFTKQDRTYQPGDIIDGTLHVNLKSKLQFQQIILKIVGKSHCQWTEGSGDDSRTYTSTMEILRDVIVMHNGPDLTEGQHKFWFNFSLPDKSIPSSFIGAHAYGNVRYYLKAKFVMDNVIKKLQSKLKCLELKKKEIFYVKGKLDLNLYPKARKRGVNQQLQERGLLLGVVCCGCKPTDVTTKMSTSKSGFVPGEEVIFSVEVENLSNSTMRRSYGQIVQIITYHAEGRTQKIEQVIAEIKNEDEILPGQRFEWSRAKLRVPRSALPTDLGGFYNIQVDYLLKFQTEKSWFRGHLKVNVPIIIGTVPLRHNS